MSGCTRFGNWDENEFFPNGTGAIMGAWSFKSL